MDKQPEALELADLFEIGNFALHRAAAAELRRLHQVNQELAEALNAAANYIDTLGGVSESYRQKLTKHKEKS
jgi:hypothetical protein